MDDETNDGRSAKFKYELKDFSAKSTTEDIAARFDADVERFSNLETGQSATIDAPPSVQLITEAAVRLTPKIERLLDFGMGRRPIIPVDWREVDAGRVSPAPRGKGRSATCDGIRIRQQTCHGPNCICFLGSV